MTRIEPLVDENVRLAEERWPTIIESSSVAVLKFLTRQYRLSLARKDVLLIDGTWYVTAAGLLGIARRHRCAGIHVRPVLDFCKSSDSRWAFKATVYRSPICKGFSGYGDADPSNVSALVRGAEMRVAETRAVNRALRKAYGIGICSVEEIRSPAGTTDPTTNAKKVPSQSINGNGWKAEPKLRDRLCQLIRQHQLDPVLVKSYAVDFCGTKTLKDASRDQVEKFVNHLADRAVKDKSGLICQLNSFVRTEGAA